MRGNLFPLQWRHNDHDTVSNHQPHGCLLNRLFRRRSKKRSKLLVTGLCVGNSPGPVNSPHKWPVTRKMFPFDDVIMHWRVVCHVVKRLLRLSLWRSRHMRIDVSQFTVTGHCAKAYQANTKRHQTYITPVPPPPPPKKTTTKQQQNKRVYKFKQCAHVMTSSCQSPKLDEKSHDCSTSRTERY